MMGPAARYDRIGRGYGAYRRADPRIAAAITSTLSDSQSVVNVGAGTGLYEPTDRPVIPVEPSIEMIRQRDPALAPAVIGTAESLPIVDGGADAVMALLTMHHWIDLARGVSEMRRVARRRIVVLTVDPVVEAQMWLLRDYVPEIAERDRDEFPAITHLAHALGPETDIVTVPVPADCEDGFLLSFWSRPEAVLDPAARAATSGFARLDDDIEHRVVTRLKADLSSGAWDARHGHLRQLPELDVGLRLLVSPGQAH